MRSLEIAHQIRLGKHNYKVWLHSISLIIDSTHFLSFILICCIPNLWSDWIGVTYKRTRPHLNKSLSRNLTRSWCCWRSKSLIKWPNRSLNLPPRSYPRGRNDLVLHQRLGYAPKVSKSNEESKLWLLDGCLFSPNMSFAVASIAKVLFLLSIPDWSPSKNKHSLRSEEGLPRTQAFYHPHSVGP